MKYIQLSELTLLENNPRQISDENFDRLKKSLSRDPKFLELRPILVYVEGEKLIIYAGNQRFKAAQELGWEEIPVIIDEKAELETIRQRILLDNVEFGEWDKDILINNWDIGELYDLDLPELNDIIEEVKTENLPNFEGQDEVPELNKRPIVMYGDIFEIKARGCKYRIGCLDSTSIYDVEKLLNGAKIDLVLTDPPYGVDITKAKRKSTAGVLGKLPEIAGDTDTEAARDFYNTCQSLGIKNYIIWGGNYFTDFLPPSRCWIVWDKVVPHDFSFAKGELAWVSMDKNLMIYKQNWSGNINGKIDLNVEGLDKETINGSSRVNRVHPTQKPVGLQLDIIKDFDDGFNNIFDGFSGGGTTLLTGIQTKKNVYASEITEYYAQVSVKRCVDFLNKNNIDFEITLNSEAFDIKILD